MPRHANRLLATVATIFAALVPAGMSQASSDYSCSPSWILASSGSDCGDRIYLAPGNDTRVNLLLLLRDRLPAGAGPRVYPKPDYPWQDMGNTFFDWDRLQAGYWPDGGAGYGGWASVCVSLGSGDGDFERAVRANKGLPGAEGTALVAARARLKATCEASDAPKAPWPEGIASAPGRAFLAYLQAADAFYAGHWAEAREGFAGLLPAKGSKVPADPWLAEAALYMVARTDLNAAMAGAFGEWGDFAGPEKVDRVTLLRARGGFLGYIATHPQGLYADSARGLVRRTVWLEGDNAALARLYTALLGSVAPDHEDAGRLVQEIDAKLLFAKDAGSAIEGPVLLAVWDLMRMRQYTQDAGSGRAPLDNGLTLMELQAQAPRFAARPDLFQYLQASHAFAVQKDMKQVLRLLPDDARQPGYGPLAFSRQVLRGLALAALRDPNEAGFWRDLLGGATGLWQRPTVELALAMNLERRGKLGEVFAPGSPITDRTVREILLLHSAGPALLRGAALAADRPGHERDLALFTLLYKQLSRGDYAGFLASRGLVPAGADAKGGLWDLIAAEAIPVGLFTAGETTGPDYACPALTATVATLARSPANPRARLCLGEFWRLNGFDGFSQPDVAPPSDELGGTPSLFPGKPLSRGTIYAQIMADPAAGADDKAYALYRAVNCYAPSGYNGCGGAEVPVSQRKAWFLRLKRDYPQSRWARKLSYYW